MEERVMGFKDALKAAIGMESEDEIEVSEDEIAEEMDKMRGDEKPVAPMGQSRQIGRAHV